MNPQQIKTLPTILIVLQGHSLSSTRGLQPDKSQAVGMAGNPAHSAMFESNLNHENLLTMSRNDVVVAIPPEHYMEESHREPGMYTARIYFTERFGAQAILGSNFIMGHEVLFDNTLGRVGFSESHCDYSRYKSEQESLRRTQLGQQRVFSGDAVEAPGLVQKDALHGSGWSRHIMSESHAGIKGSEVGAVNQLRIPG